MDLETAMAYIDFTNQIKALKEENEKLKELLKAYTEANEEPGFNPS